MFQVEGPVLCVFKPILKVFPKPISDTFYKSPWIVAIFTKKGLELFLEYNNIRPFFQSISAFVLFCNNMARALAYGTTVVPGSPGSCTTNNYEYDRILKYYM